MIDEDKVMKTIILGNDWQDVMSELVVDEGMDPMRIDIVKLTDSFTNYLQRLKSFDFRVPARFVLIAAILLRMKCELMLDEEEQKVLKEKESVPPINIDNVPMLSAPMERKPVRKVTLSELVNALNKALDFKEKKETRKFRMRRAVENLIEPEEDIEIKINSIFESILGKGRTTLSHLVPVWKRKQIVETFLPLLYLIKNDKIVCEQEEFFKEITIKLK